MTEMTSVGTDKEEMSWSCRRCGATTTDPEERLIEYFHLGCKA